MTTIFKNKSLFNLIVILFSFFSLFILQKTEASVTIWQYSVTSPVPHTYTFKTQLECGNNRALYLQNIGGQPTLCESVVSSGYPTVTNVYEISPKVGGDINFNETYKLLAPIGEFDKIETNDIWVYFNKFLSIAIGLAGALAVIMIIIGGVEWMGNDSIFGKTKAKERITSAILGLLIALGSYALLNTINPDLVGRRGLNIDQVSISLEEPPVFSNKNTVVPTGSDNSFPPECPGGVSKVKLEREDYILCTAYISKFKPMFSDAAAKGIILSGGSFRTKAEQIDARINNNCPDIYKSPSNKCNPPTAIPGTSMHEKGLAFDLKCDGKLINWDNQQSKYAKSPETKKCFDWLVENASKYGLKNYSKENWHWSINGN